MNPLYVIFFKTDLNIEVLQTNLTFFEGDKMCADNIFFIKIIQQNVYI